MATVRELILKAPDCKEKKRIDVPQWPETHGKLFVKQMSYKDRTLYESWMMQLDDKKPVDLYVKVAALVLVDEQGVPVFKQDEFELLAEKHPDAILFIYEEAIRYNILTKQSQEELKKN